MRTPMSRSMSSHVLASLLTGLKHSHILSMTNYLSELALDAPSKHALHYHVNLRISILKHSISSCTCLTPCNSYPHDNATSFPVPSPTSLLLDSTSSLLILQNRSQVYNFYFCIFNTSLLSNRQKLQLLNKLHRRHRNHHVIPRASIVEYVNLSQHEQIICFGAAYSSDITGDGPANMQSSPLFNQFDPIFDSTGVIYIFFFFDDIEINLQ